jgi:CubicO group peptidase (beta-lactamase class C family)
MLTTMPERLEPAATATTAPDPAAALLDIGAAIEQHVESSFSPSGIVAVARYGTVLRSQAWGDDDYDVRTPFRVASCTKSFTALALLILRREGRLGLDDAVVDHLPELKVEAPADWPQLRIRHLLSMSSGLATDNPWGDRQESRSRAELGDWLRSGLRLIFPPGSSSEYSNLGYAFLGEVITRLSGQEYREFVRERIIDPLGLHDTRFAAGELDRVAPGYHREPGLPGQPGGWTPQEPSEPGVFSPIGGLYSSVQDLASWAGLYLTRDVPAGVSFTAADLLEAQQPLSHLSAGQAEPPLRGHVARGYGYGLVIETFTDHGTVVSHSGGYPGFTTYMCWHKESGYTVISSCNGTHSGSTGPARRMLLPLVAAATSKPSLIGAASDPTAGTSATRPAAKIETWPETLAAASRLEDLVREVPTAAAVELAARYADLFAENVEMDFPVARRVEYLKQALVNLGALRPATAGRLPTSERPSQARWSVPAEFGRLELYIELMPVAPFQVQTFSAEVVNGWSKVELF